MPISGVRSFKPSRARYAMRSASTIQAPCGILPTGPAKPSVRAATLRHRVAMHDHRARARPASLRSMGISYCGPRSSVRTWRSRELQRLRAAVDFHFLQIRVPVAAPDGHIGDQVMQIGFVQHHHSRMLPRRVIHEDVMRIVAQLIERWHRNAKQDRTRRAVRRTPPPRRCGSKDPAARRNNPRCRSLPAAEAKKTPAASPSGSISTAERAKRAAECGPAQESGRHPWRRKSPP